MTLFFDQRRCCASSKCWIKLFQWELECGIDCLNKPAWVLCFCLFISISHRNSVSVYESNCTYVVWAQFSLWLFWFTAYLFSRQKNWFKKKQKSEIHKLSCQLATWRWLDACSYQRDKFRWSTWQVATQTHMDADCPVMCVHALQGHAGWILSIHISSIFTPQLSHALGVGLLLECKQFQIYTLHKSFFIHYRCSFRTSQQPDIAIKQRGEVGQIHRERKKKIDRWAGHM